MLNKHLGLADPKYNLNDSIGQTTLRQRFKIQCFLKDDKIHIPELRNSECAFQFEVHHLCFKDLNRCLP